MKVCANEVTVWQLDLPMLWASYEELPGLLDESERARAAIISQENARKRFVIVRAALRRILANHLNCEAKTLAFEYGEQGKPNLAPEFGECQFSVTHSGDRALIAVAESTSVGIDIEAIRYRRRFMELARRFFTIEEAEEIAAFPAEDQLRAFYRCWTCKEAVLKASGRGIAGGLKTFSIPLAREWTALRLDLADGLSYRLFALPEDEPYCAALACMAVEKAPTVILRNFLSER